MILRVTQSHNKRAKYVVSARTHWGSLIGEGRGKGNKGRDYLLLIIELLATGLDRIDVVYFPLFCVVVYFFPLVNTCFFVLGLVFFNLLAWYNTGWTVGWQVVYCITCVMGPPEMFWPIVTWVLILPCLHTFNSCKWLAETSVSVGNTVVPAALMHCAGLFRIFLLNYFHVVVTGRPAVWKYGVVVIWNCCSYFPRVLSMVVWYVYVWMIIFCSLLWHHWRFGNIRAANP